MNERRIVDVLEYLGIYDSGASFRNGAYITHPCPFADKTHKGGRDRNPSFGIAIVNDNYSFYNCFTCKQKGKLVLLPDMLARVIDENIGGNPSGVVYVEGLERESLKQSGLERPNIIDEAKEKPIPLVKAIYENIYNPVWGYPDAREYLEKRGISEQTSEKIGLCFDEDEQRIIFPIYGADRQLYGFTGRTILENWKDHDNPPLNRYPRIKDYHGFRKNWFMLGEHVIDRKKPTFVVEGLFGYASLIEKGVDEICNVVAILGSSLSGQKAKTLIDSGTSVFLMLDNDKAGEIGIFGDKINNIKGAIGHLYRYTRVFVPEWPEGKKDPDELLKKDVAIIINTTYTYKVVTQHAEGFHKRTSDRSTGSH